MPDVFEHPIPDEADVRKQTIKATGTAVVRRYGKIPENESDSLISRKLEQLEELFGEGSRNPDDTGISLKTE